MSKEFCFSKVSNSNGGFESFFLTLPLTKIYVQKRLLFDQEEHLRFHSQNSWKILIIVIYKITGHNFYCTHWLLLFTVLYIMVATSSSINSLLKAEPLYQNDQYYSRVSQS